MHTIQELVAKLAEKEFKCPNCGARFEDDDFAYLQETGQCQYCHKNIEINTNNIKQTY